MDSVKANSQPTMLEYGVKLGASAAAGGALFGGMTAIQQKCRLQNFKDGHFADTVELSKMSSESKSIYNNLLKNRKLHMPEIWKSAKIGAGLLSGIYALSCVFKHISRKNADKRIEELAKTTPQ